MGDFGTLEPGTLTIDGGDSSTHPKRGIILWINKDIMAIFHI